MAKRILTLLLRTPEDLSNNLVSNLGGFDCTSPVFALGILQTLSDVNLGPEKGRLDQKVPLESGVHDSQGGGVGRQPNEAKGRINRGIREADMERRVVGEGVDEEFTAGVILGGGEEGYVAVNRAVRGFDEKLGEISKLILVAGTLLFGIVCESNIDSNGRIPGLEHQELSSSKISDDWAILGPEMTAVNAQSL